LTGIASQLRQLTSVVADGGTAATVLMVTKTLKSLVDLELLGSSEARGIHLESNKGLYLKPTSTVSKERSHGVVGGGGSLEK